MTTKLFVATKAFVRFGDKILIVKESSQYQDGANLGKFDVPGGRIRAGQRFDESLKREVKEETGLDIEIGEPFFVDEWRPVVRGEQWQIVGVYFECLAKSEEVVLSQDHEEFRWINPEEYTKHELIRGVDVVFKHYLVKRAKREQA